MKTTKLGALLASSAMGIAMTPAERRMGRLMRAPDDHPTPAPKDPIEAMMDDDGVEGQWGGDDGKKAPPAEKKPKAQPPVDDADEGNDDDSQEGADDDEGDADEGEENEEDGKQKPGKKPASERIRELNRLLKEERRRNREIESRIERIEKGLPAEEKGDKPVEEKVAPDPNDLEKYPLGALDDRYIEDKLDFLADKKAEEKLNRTLQRQQEEDQEAESLRVLTELRQKADTLTDKGTDLFEDFEEKVVTRAMQGAFPLSQETFEACSEAEHGAAILYALATDTKEAERVAALSPYQQMKYVAEKDAEKAGKRSKRTTQAGDPPSNVPRGSRGKFEVADDTDDLDAFGKKFDSL